MAKKTLTTKEFIEKTINSVQTDIYNYSKRGNTALSEFRRVADELGAVNDGLSSSLEQLASLENFIFEQKTQIKTAIDDNDAARDKILDIISPGERKGV